MFTLKDKTLVGNVVNNEDPNEQGRVQVVFEGLNDLIPLELVNWLTVSYTCSVNGNTTLGIPNLGTRVKVLFLDDSIASGVVVGIFSQWTVNSS